MTNALPPGWASVPLSSIGTWLGGGTPSKSVKEYWASGTVPWVSPKDMKRLLIDCAQDQITEKAVKESATNLIPASSVLMVTRSGILEHTFPVAVNTVPVTINQDLKAWTPAHGIDPLYVAYFLRFRGQLILDTCSKDGTTVSSIDFDRLSRFEVSLAPSQVQTRIVSKIDELFSEIEEGERALERVQKLVERYRQSVLKAAVTGELTREWRGKHKGQLESGEELLQRILKARREEWEHAELRKIKSKGAKTTSGAWRKKYREPIEPDVTDLPRLPKTWVWASIDQISSDALIGLDRGAAQQRNDPVGAPYIKMNNITMNGEVFLRDLVYVRATAEEKAKFKVQKGDILFNTRNSKELVGKTGLVRNPPEDAIYNNNIMRIRTVQDLDSRYVVAHMCEPSFRARLELVKKATTSVAAVYAKDLFPLAIAVPPPAEQLVLVSAVEQAMSQANAVLTEIGSRIATSQALRQAILKAAFSGALVPQDSRDESAASLIQRIASGHGLPSRFTFDRNRQRQATT